MDVHVHMQVEKLGCATYRANAWILNAGTGEVLKTDQFTVKGSDIYQRTMGKVKKAARYLYKPENMTSTIDFKEGEDVEGTEAEVYGE